MEMSAEEFEMHVADALDGIPEELAALVDNCVIFVRALPATGSTSHARALLRCSTDRTRRVLHRPA